MKWMYLYSLVVVFWSENAVVTSGVAGVRAIYLMESPSFIKPVCYSLCNCLQSVTQTSQLSIQPDSIWRKGNNKAKTLCNSSNVFNLYKHTSFSFGDFIYLWYNVQTLWVICLPINLHYKKVLWFHRALTPEASVFCNVALSHGNALWNQQTFL